MIPKSSVLQTRKRKKKVRTDHGSAGSCDGGGGSNSGDASGGVVVKFGSRNNQPHHTLG